MSSSLSSSLRRIDRGRRALALALLGDLDAVADALRHAAVRPDDRDDPIGARTARGIDDPFEHGPTADRVKHLRQSATASGCRAPRP